MTIRRYSYIVGGAGANDRSWETAGVVACEWHEVFDCASTEAFRALTEGHDHPDCSGPYQIRRMVIERLSE